MPQPHSCLAQGAGMAQRWQEATASITLLPICATAPWLGQQPRRDRGVQRGLTVSWSGMVMCDQRERDLQFKLVLCNARGGSCNA